VIHSTPLVNFLCCIWYRNSKASGLVYYSNGAYSPLEAPSSEEIIYFLYDMEDKFDPTINRRDARKFIAFSEKVQEAE
jgi:hypothetical protein